jgi:AraC-like DNA-binding protein
MARNTRAAALEHRPEPIVAVGNFYPAGHIHPRHRHRRDQLLYASTGVMVVGTDQGAWVVPPQQAIWIPASVDHEIRMIGDVATRSTYLKDGVIRKAPGRCQVLGVSPLLSRLLMEAVDLPVAWQSCARASHIMQLILLELASSVELPLCVPIPLHARLASKCRRFLAKPNTQDTVDDWSDALHMSRRAFTRLFREETGMSLSAWRQQAIVVVALSRLLSGESVTAVAMDYGYSNAGAFSSMFRRITGTTPTDYLARNEGGRKAGDRRLLLQPRPALAGRG